jgi:hypothetical protein
LEARAIIGTLPEEREQREKVVTMIVEHIKNLEAKCAKLCEEIT